MKVQRRKMLCADNRSRPERPAHLALGAAPVAILLRRYFLRPTHVGVKRKSIRVHYPVCLPIHVGRPARGLVNDVHTLATRFATLGPVHHVRLWAQRKTVSVEGIRLPSVARIPTTKTDGAVVRSVATYCPAECILVPDRATKVFAVLAMSRSRHVAIVGTCRPRCCVVLEMKRWRARSYVTILVRLKAGRAASVAEKFATVLSTAVFTSARRVVIRKIRNPHIVQGRPMSYSIVLVERRLWRRYLDTPRERPARTPFHTVLKRVVRHCHVDIHVKNFVTPVHVVLVCSGFRYRVAVVVIR